MPTRKPRLGRGSQVPRAWELAQDLRFKTTVAVPRLPAWLLLR